MKERQKEKRTQSNHRKVPFALKSTYKITQNDGFVKLRC